MTEPQPAPGIPEDEDPTAEDDKIEPSDNSGEWGQPEPSQDPENIPEGSVS